ncbi:interferon regulatory factor 3 isoform X1 [Pygocentrus nattereri]|uniref:IRF tryptophan pentad repeat domain-containing protein n=1 Tax=Pygocentrus nattereri TaxID=42514 RepID=A0AAR2KQJ9_PYGNA|nr:interferon regulatory factor 3 isoform X1 [Pygocentrus nattereri]
MDQNKNKPLFVPWLRRQVDSGQYPGVQWLNHEHTLFAIPWKHALRQDSNSDDIRIFKAWAQTGVCSDGRIQGDPSVWKRNFRSALRARGFKLELDNKNDAANPHKVFKWPEDGQSGESREASQECDGEIPVCDVLYLADDEMFPGGVAPSDLLEQCLVGLNIGGSEQESQRPFAVDDQFLMEPPVGGDQYSAAVAIPAVDSVIGEVFSIQETLNMGQFSPVGGAAGMGHVSPAEGAVALGQFSPLESAFMGTEEPVLGQPMPVHDTANNSGPGQFSTHYKVTVYYKGTKVLEQLVENDAGFRLVSRKDPSLMADALPVLELPGIDSILDQTQASSTNDILVNLGGLEVRKVGATVYGHRWGDSRVYWGLCKHERGAEPRPLSKNQPEPIYHFKDFRTGLIAFMENSGTRSPLYTLFFFLGQNWPDPRNKPWEKKLIMVEVVLTSLEKLKLMAVENGASSLQSDELQLSLEQMMEMC